MPILSLIVYGSRARKDNTVESDTDLFAITDDNRYEMIIEGNTNIACYPLSLAISRAKGGDLFFMHIVSEAMAIYDPTESFTKIKESFKKKKDYITEITQASELGFALVAYAKHMQDYYLLNTRLAWCLRTILIARSVEMGKPTFSKEGLALLFKDKSLAELVALKDSTNYVAKAYPEFRSAFMTYGVNPDKEMPTDISDLVEYFSARENSMGLKTARLLSHDVELEGYAWS